MCAELHCLTCISVSVSLMIDCVRLERGTCWSSRTRHVAIRVLQNVVS